ncbi:MAG: hypothetical protein AUK44_03190 [Porphyromonadaceae bacterium CG2_30_38_12]|nr:MAG: hypothetical protein AUK44_03190 [Porphyromonadaceae bacterium CG2_30_38_12]
MRINLTNYALIRLLIGFILVVSSISLSAQNEEIKRANAAYKNKNYIEAAHQYELISKKYGVSPYLFYNTGNAYYKANEIGKSILNYERALRLAPNYEDAKTNLEFAQLKVVDNIVQVPPFFLKRWIEFIIKLVSVDGWFYISIVSLLVALACFLFFVFGNVVIWRKLSFYSAFVLLSFSLVFGISAAVRKSQFTDHSSAIVMAGVMNVKSSPDKSGTDLFQLHEGTKVLINSVLDEWVEIKVGNGNVGWVVADQLAVINEL